MTVLVRYSPDGPAPESRRPVAPIEVIAAVCGLLAAHGHHPELTPVDYFRAYGAARELVAAFRVPVHPVSPPASPEAP